MSRLYLPLLALGAFAAFADERTEIDKDLKKCLASERVRTAPDAAMECYSRTERAWDAELTKVFNTLVEKTPEDDRGKARTHQEEWAKERDAWFAQFAKKHPPKVAAERRIDFLKERVDHLILQLAGLKQ